MIPPADLISAPKIEGIELLCVLGRGAHSVVYKARQLQLDRLVAVKVLSKTDEISAARFRQEAKVTSELVHPNIVSLMGYGLSQEQQPYLVLEFLEGHTLEAEFAKMRSRLSRFKEIFISILSALSHAHQAGLVHRDIKPSNIMICERNEGSIVKMLDFGVAKIESDNSHFTEQRLTKTGSLLGSPKYMSPEQCKGQSVDARCDIYSVSVVMFESLCGR